VASAVDLAWNPNPEADITSYQLSYGTSPGLRPTVINVGNQTAANVSGLEPGQTYYFAVAAINQSGQQSSPSAEISYQEPAVPPGPTIPLISSTGWTLKFATSEETEDEDGRALNAFDGNPSTYWITRWVSNPTQPPHDLQIDTGTAQSMQGFRYLPRQDGYNFGNIGQYEFYTSLDGVNWGTPVASGTFTNTQTQKEVLFPSRNARYVRLRALTDLNGGTLLGHQLTCVAELRLLQGDALPPPENQAPVASAKSITTAEDTAASALISATDANGDTLTFTVVTNPSQGKLTGTAPNLTYTPNADYHGTDSFTFKANDGKADSNIATVSITVTPVNDAPVAVAKSLTTNEDQSAGVVLSATDKDGNPLTYSVVSSPAQGKLTGTAPNLTYAPNADYHGPDSFTYKANDGKADSNIATVSITVNPVNDAPVVVAKSAVTPRETPIAILLSGSDKDNDTLTYGIVGAPAHGSLSGTGANLTYTPSPGYDGPDSFTYKANDGKVDSNIATVSITVTPVNDAPVAVAKSIITDEDQSAGVALSATDKDGNPLTYSIVSSPAQGKLTGTAPNLTYAPNADYHGPDSFTYKANDGKADSNLATVSITVNPVNDAPVVVAKSAVTPRESPVAIVLSGSDKDNDALTYGIVVAPAHGSLSGTGANLTYTPSPGYDGPDSFTYKANDGKADSNIATFSITVTPVNDAPVAVAKSLTTNEDQSAGVALSATDKDGNPLTYSIVNSPAQGKLTGTAPNLTYAPNADYHGPDSFTFKANDGKADSNIATVSITVNPVNDAPVADAKSSATLKGSPVGIVLSGSDKDGDPLTGLIVGNPSKGALTGTAPNLTYAPNADSSGEDSFTYKMNDGKADSNIATVSITITPTADNSPPVAAFKAVGVIEDRNIGIALSATDPEKNPLTFKIVGGPANGTLSGTPPNVYYTPSPNFHGADSFTFQANDGISDSNVAVVAIQVSPVNDAPVASPAVIESINDTSVAVTLPVTDVDSPSLAYKIIKRPVNGRLSGIAPALIYTPAPGFSGTDRFSFTANDGKSNSNTGWITLIIKDPNDAPVFTANPITMQAASSGIAYIGQSLAPWVWDPDKAEALVFSKTSGPDWLAVSANGTLSGTPPVEAEGTNEFAVRVTDKGGISADAVLRIDVHPPALPMPWEMTQIGTSGMQDVAAYESPTFTLSGSGNLANGGDQGCLVWQTLSGDGQIIARVSAQAAATPYGTSGVMIRSSLAVNSPHVFLGLTGNGVIRRTSRIRAGTAAVMKNHGFVNPPRLWLRLVRKGNVIHAFRSPNGIKWTLIDSTTANFGPTCYIGMVVSGGMMSQATSAFSNVTVVP
jgi:hypothetical protein